MSSTYAGSDTFPTPITIPDDGDAAAMTVLGAAVEGLADRTVFLRSQMKRPVLIQCGSIPFVTFTGTFTPDQNDQSVVTSVAIGGEYRARIAVLDGETISSIDVFFVPDAGPRGGALGTAPKVRLLRLAISAGGTPAAPSVVATATYVPDGTYEDSKYKVMTVSPAHAVDAEGYAYYLSIVDEDGANAIVGNAYVAFRVNYS